MGRGGACSVLVRVVWLWLACLGFVRQSGAMTQAQWLALQRAERDETGAEAAEPVDLRAHTLCAGLSVYVHELPAYSRVRRACTPTAH